MWLGLRPLVGAPGCQRALVEENRLPAGSIKLGLRIGSCARGHFRSSKCALQHTALTQGAARTFTILTCDPRDPSHRHGRQRPQLRARAPLQYHPHESTRDILQHQATCSEILGRFAPLVARCCACRGYHTPSDRLAILTSTLLEVAWGPVSPVDSIFAWENPRRACCHQQS